MDTYEKKYNEALERAKDFKNGIVQFALDPGESIVHYIFPELRESEDEWIRKEIIEYLKLHDKGENDYAHPMFSKWFAWLEKQKELTPADGWDYADKRMSHPLYWEGFEAGRAVERELSEFEKQKEQKPESLTKYVYSKNDKEFIQGCSDILVANGYATKAERLLLMFEQKPISQEDFDTAKHEALWGEQNARDYCSVRDEFDLDGNLKQKPAEWSEEDKVKIHFLSRLIEFQVKDGEYCFGGNGTVSKQEAIEMLKSLRPSWKLSEDEERLINTSISFLKDFADKGYENAVECIDWLKSKLNGNSGK